METCLIITGGAYEALPELSYDFLIACDKGYSYAKRQGLSVNLCLGDFDSYEGKPPETGQIYPKEKDDTDTMLAVKYACEQKYDHIILSCAYGNRLDHLLGNLSAAVYAARQGVTVWIPGIEEEVHVLGKGEISVKRREGFSISLLSATDTCGPVYATGLKYKLEGTMLTNAFPLGISNEFLEEEAHIRVEAGVLLVIQSKM